MNTDNSSGQEGIKDLEHLLQLLGYHQAEFCRRIGIDARTVSRWKTKGTKPMLTLPQAKRLYEEMKAKDLDFSSLPDNFLSSDASR